MQSYPLGKTNFATSVTTASLSATATFLLSSVSTASIALNFSGSIGPSGSEYIKSGSQGVQGPAGPTGPKGFGVYLLSSSLASCCNQFDSFTGWIGTTDSSGFGQCDTGKYTNSIGAFIYSTCSSLNNGCVVYSNSTCVTALPYNAITDGSGTYYELNGSGTITNNAGVCNL